jgi:hypothetical protein
VENRHQLGTRRDGAKTAEPALRHTGQLSKQCVRKVVERFRISLNINWESHDACGTTGTDPKTLALRLHGPPGGKTGAALWRVMLQLNPWDRPVVVTHFPVPQRADNCLRTGTTTTCGGALTNGYLSRLRIIDSELREYRTNANRWPTSAYLEVGIRSTSRRNEGAALGPVEGFRRKRIRNCGDEKDQSFGSRQAISGPVR